MSTGWTSPVFEPRPLDRLIALGLCAATSLCLVSTSRQVGVARDEGIYIHAARTYRGYVDAVKKGARRGDAKTIERFYRENWEHPPGTKHLYGLSWKLFHRCHCHEQFPRARKVKPPHDSAGWLDDLTAMRLPAMLLAGALVGFIYLFGAALWGRFAGLAAALAYITLPRVYFHSHLAGLDAPVTAIQLITVYAYYRALHSWRWGVATGLLFALALLTKFNALMLPLVLIVHYAWATRRDFRHPLLAVTGIGSLLPLLFVALSAVVAGHALGWAAVAAVSAVGLYLTRRDSLTRPLRALSRMAPFVFFSMLVLGFGLFYLQWPWLWDQGGERFGAYLSYHLEHTFYNTEYYGKNYNLPPFPVSFPFVMTLLTMPLAFLIASATGLGLAIHRGLAPLWGSADNAAEAPTPARSFGRPLAGQDRSGAFLIGLNALFPLVLIAAPSTPIFGGTRLWMPAWPFLALLAGWGVQWMARRLAPTFGPRLGRTTQPALTGLLIAALILPGVIQTAHAGDLAPSYYTPGGGGTPGAATRGMKRQYWGYSTRRLLPQLNRWAAAAARGPHRRFARTPVYFHDTNHYSRNAYVRSGLLDARITYAGDGYPAIRRSEIALFLHEKHQVMWEHFIWQEYGSLQPIHVVTLGGVPLVTVYRRPPGRRARPSPPFFFDPPGFRRLARRRR